MRCTTNPLLPFLLLLSLLGITLLTSALPARHPSNLLGPSSSKHKRQFEEELLQGAEDSIELFDAPRVHDSSEKIHEGTTQHNITAQSIMDAIRQRQRQQRLNQAYLQQGGYSYSKQNAYSGYSRYSGYNRYSQDFGPSAYRQETGYSGYSRQSGYGRTYRQDTVSSDFSRNSGYGGYSRYQRESYK
ncbi:uncharacterized protein UTRI_10409_B [Ustilago trichophora]|uniref:Uncharacterized protein n=1 Tax=Ustilago trichophora TaxID=86804 RepID=A0A5C3E9T5_9BASI|nr:uncharacterized protein UTRI_10409_B [Ustilago trichophora]